MEVGLFAEYNTAAVAAALTFLQSRKGVIYLITMNCDLCYFLLYQAALFQIWQLALNIDRYSQMLRSNFTHSVHLEFGNDMHDD